MAQQNAYWGGSEVRKMQMPFLRKHGNTWHWEPSAAARRLGFKNVRLGADDAAAAREAGKLWDQYQEKKRAAAAVYDGSFRQLRDLYYESREWKRTAVETKRDYRRHIEKTIIAEFGDEQVVSVNAEVVAALHDRYADRPYAGNHCLRVLSTLFRCALQHPSVFGVTVNPCDAITAYGIKEGVKSRERVWADEEVTAFDAAADAETKMARLLYSFTGQRTIDVLAMKDTDYKVDPNGDRWLHVAQHKGGKRLWIYCHAGLWPAIEAHIALHRKAHNSGSILEIGAPLIQNTKAAAFNRRVFVMRWDRTAVRAGIVTLGAKDEKTGHRARRSRENPTRHDLRRTATTLLAEAGCTEDEISSITGLSIVMIRRQIYNVRTKAHSKAGIKKMEEYRK
jgi:integrase